MAQQSRSTLKGYFQSGDRPTGTQFEELIDSFVSHQDDSFVHSLPDATITQKGIAEQATLAEVNTGTDDTKFVTSKGAKQAAETHAPVLSVNGQTGNVSVGDDSGWQPAPLMNGFIDYGANWQIARFRRLNGVVYLEGSIKNGAPSVPIFILPPGFMPVDKLIFSTIGNNTLARIDIDSNGVVEANVHNSQWISLSGISFVVA